MFRARARLATLVFLVACGAADDVQFMAVAPQSAQAVSLLGDTLWSVPIPVERGQRLVADLHVARGEYAARPDDVAYRVAVARRTAALGRLREALDLYTAAANRHFDDPRPLRYRGELLLYMRQFRLGASDLRRAVQALSWTESEALLEIPAHSSAPGGALPFGAWFHLGLANYLIGDLDEARAAYQHSLGQASDPSEFARGAVWLWFTLMRLDRPAEAAELLGFADRVLTLPAQTPEHRLLQALGSHRPEEAIRGLVAQAPRTEADALLGYGLAVLRLVAGRQSEAASTLAWVRQYPDWASPEHVAAEADLHRLGQVTAAARRPGT